MIFLYILLVYVSRTYILLLSTLTNSFHPVLVMGASIFGAGFPVAAKKISWLKVPEKVFFACKHFGTGVLVATAFVHVCLLIEIIIRSSAFTNNFHQSFSLLLLAVCPTHAFQICLPTTIPPCLVQS